MTGKEARYQIELWWLLLYSKLMVRCKKRKHLSVDTLQPDDRSYVPGDRPGVTITMWHVNNEFIFVVRAWCVAPTVQGYIIVPTSCAGFLRLYSHQGRQTGWAPLLQREKQTNKHMNILEISGGGLNAAHILFLKRMYNSNCHGDGIARLMRQQVVKSAEWMNHRFVTRMWLRTRIRVAPAKRSANLAHKVKLPLWYS